MGWESLATWSGSRCLWKACSKRTLRMLTGAQVGRCHQAQDQQPAVDVRGSAQYSACHLAEVACDHSLGFTVPAGPEEGCGRPDVLLVHDQDIDAACAIVRIITAQGNTAILASILPRLMRCPVCPVYVHGPGLPYCPPHC
jgi:hypothetical protein